jgi:tRNA dimethylallyltransferase
LIAIVGETASGKSSLALALAERFDGEIITADSWTVYPGFDIGTAKPSAESRAKIPHHLLDVADPRYGFNAPEFQEMAHAAIADISSRSKLPFLVGGTGLYVDSVLYNFSFLPAPSAEIRDQLNNLSLEDLQQKVRDAELDMASIDMQNKRRVIRLLENNGAKPSKQKLRQNTLLLGMGIQQDQLRERVVQRVDAMLAKGLEQEVRQLAATYGWESEPMKGIGYREWQEYICGNQPFAHVREKIISATLNLAKRQRTWFQHNKSIHWLNTEDKLTASIDLITSFLDK